MAAHEHRQLFSKIPSVLAAEVMSFLPFVDTLKSLLLAQAAREALSHRAAWDPLHLEQQECSNLIRYLMKWGKRRSVPSGIYQVTEFRANVGSADFNGEPRMRYLHPVCPLQSLCEVLHDSFSRITKLELTNIEDCDIDFDDARRGWGFLMIRSSLLADFNSVSLKVSDMQPKGIDSCTQALYKLTATKEGEFPLLADVESLFLREHQACTRISDRFCVGHARQRQFIYDSVQKHYAAVHARNRTQCIQPLIQGR
jgi:hypothetical protein